jgi:hypothetical protein
MFARLTFRVRLPFAGAEKRKWSNGRRHIH